MSRFYSGRALCEAMPEIQTWARSCFPGRGVEMWSCVLLKVAWSQGWMWPEIKAIQLFLIMVSDAALLSLRWNGCCFLLTKVTKWPGGAKFTCLQRVYSWYNINRTSVTETDPQQRIMDSMNLIKEGNEAELCEIGEWEKGLRKWNLRHEETEGSCPG